MVNIVNKNKTKQNRISIKIKCNKTNYWCEYHWYTNKHKHMIHIGTLYVSVFGQMNWFLSNFHFRLHYIRFLLMFCHIRVCLYDQLSVKSDFYFWSYRHQKNINRNHSWNFLSFFLFGTQINDDNVDNIMIMFVHNVSVFFFSYAHYLWIFHHLFGLIFVVVPLSHRHIGYILVINWKIFKNFSHWYNKDDKCNTKIYFFWNLR